MAGEISAAIKMGYDISKSGVLIADYKHFSKEIIDGLKKGIYHIRQSKEVAGNYRPAILDKDEQLVKFFTLKKAIKPDSVLSDISTLSMQNQLNKISMQIEDIKNYQKDLIDFTRRINLSNKFLYARDKINQAHSSSSYDEIIEHVKDTDTYLMEGLTNLYVDLNDQIKNSMLLNLQSLRLIESTPCYYI